MNMMTSNMSAIIAARTGPYILSGAYANTLTGVIGSLYAGLDVVSRELVGFLPSVSRDASMERAAVGQTVTFHVAPPATVGNVTPAMAVPEPTDQTIGSGTMTITKARQTSFGWTGEEQRALNGVNASGRLDVQADLFAQGLRGLVNEFEGDVAAAAAAGASRATGTAGTTPFASGVGDTAQLKKILDDNGAPQTNRSLIINTSAGAALRTNTQLTKANESGTIMTLRDGALLDMHGFAIKETGQAVSHTAGTAASSTTNNAGYAIGATTITLASAGTGTFTAGDVVSFAGDPNLYVIVTGDADVSNGGTIVLQAPGLMVAIPASATAITRRATYAANVGFSPDAIVIGARQPALPDEGDLAMDRMALTDPRSGITFEISLYPGYRKIRAEVALAWGVKVIKPAHIALLMG